jgi:hypothetical protein
MKNLDDQYFGNYRFNERSQRLISAVLISLMMASAGVTVAQFGHQMVPNWHGEYLAILGILFTFERFFSHRTIKRLSIFSREWIVFVSTQWVVNILLIKLVATLTYGVETLIAEIPLWQEAFIQNFFNPNFIVALLFSVLVWLFVGVITELLDEMGLDAALVNREVMSSSIQDRTPPRQRVMATVFGVGGGLMFLTAAARVDTRALFANEAGVFKQLSPLEGGGAGTLLYFLFGFALLSQSQYLTLNIRWFLQGVPVSRTIAIKWAIYSFSFMLLIVLIVSVLPTNYSIGLLSVLGYLIDLVMGIVILIFTILLTIVSFIISLPFMLLGLKSPTSSPNNVIQPPVETPPPAIITESTPFPWFELLKSILFWSVFLIIIGYSISQYLRQHEQILDGLRKIPGWKIFSTFFRWVTGVFTGLNKRVTNIFQSGVARLSPQTDTPRKISFGRMFRLRNLTSRQRVIFYYQALLRRGSETGVPREESQTPDEYASRLEQTIPTVTHEVVSLTEAFNEARYSQHSIDQEDASAVKVSWERIRKVFRGRRG